MDERITVSVVVPVYNESRCIDRMICSLMEQNYPREQMEWIMVDGDSADGTADMIRRYAADCPIVLLSNPRHKTPVSVNMGIQAARGKYVIRLDAHAEYPKDYIEKCVGYLETTDADNVGGSWETKGEGFMGRAIARMLTTPFGVGDSQFRLEDRSGYVDTVPFGAFRKEIFDKVGLFNEELLRSEDNEMNARIRSHGGKIYLAADIHCTYYCRNTVGGILKMGAQNGNALFRTLKVSPKAMSVRHFIPALFVLSLIALPLLGIWSKLFLWLFAAEMGAYLLLDLYFSFGQGQPGYGLVTLWLYPLFHIVYGCGSFLGLFGVKLY